MTYAHALGKGGGGGHGGGGHGGGGHGAGGHGGGYGGRRGGFRGRGGWDWWGPGYVDYYSYSPCDECVGMPPSLYLRCLAYYGCVSPLYGLGQTSTVIPSTSATQAATTAIAQTSVDTVVGVGIAGILGVGLAGVGLVWWLKSRRKKSRS